MAVGKSDFEVTSPPLQGGSFQAEYLSVSEPWDLRGVPGLVAGAAGQLNRPIEVACYAVKGFNAYAPTTGAASTGGNQLGAPWTLSGTVTHPNPTSGILNQRKRTRFLDVITTTNQELGVRFNATSELQYTRGTGAGLGGFFFASAFVLSGSTNVATKRLFAGLADSTTAVVISDTLAGNVIGLWHDTTDAVGVLNLVVRNNTTTTKIPIAGAPASALAAGQGYAFYMACAPNSTTVSFRLDDLLAGTTIIDSSINTTGQPNMPLNTAFMGPQVETSNGTANIVAGDTGIDIIGVYCEG
jgi:hypothetical protein